MWSITIAFAVLLAAVGPCAGARDTVDLHLPCPTRQLEWKDINVLSISDSHGWLLGHQHTTWPEPNYSGDYGSFASFVSHMRGLADEKGVDLLLVDAGDHHDGSGLVSSSFDSASRTDEIFNMVDFDVMTIGNHELYEYWPAKEVYDNKKKYGGRYLTSNVNITVEENGEWFSRPVGEQYSKFTTKQGHNVTAFGVIFNFQAHGQNLTIQSPSMLVHETWFIEAIFTPPDYFVLVGHMPIRKDPSAQWRPVFNAIRKRHPHVPILIFGGHDHTRDCAQFDDHSIAVVPGRYMETVGFTSSSLPNSDDRQKPLDMSRRYLDANPQSYMWHTNTTPSTFDTAQGQNITRHLLDLAASLGIAIPLGTAPSDYFLLRYPAGHPKHINTVLTQQILPNVLIDQKRKGKKRVVIGNAGSMRFDIFRGPFSRNDELTISPFPSAYTYVTMKAGFAKRITDQMNENGATKLLPASGSDSLSVGRSMQDEDARIESVYQHTLAESWDEYASRLEHRHGTTVRRHDQVVFLDREETEVVPTMGYVTRDSCPGVGDDIEHIPVPVSDLQVDFVQTEFPEAEDDELIDVVVLDFTLDDFFIAVKMLDPLNDLKPSDMQPYAEGIKLNAVWGMYAQQAWRP